MGYERFAPVERRIDVLGTPYTVWQPPGMEALIDIGAFEADERIPYWADVWESAIVLAEDLATCDGRGLTLLELGCGIGLPAIVAARRGYAATASDYEADALEAARYNAAANGAADLAVRLLDWRDLPADLGTFDRVVAADVLYEKHHARALATVLARTLAPGGLGLVADPGRARAVEFEPACQAASLGVERLPARRPRGATGGPGIELYVVRRRASSPAPRP